MRSTQKSALSLPGLGIVGALSLVYLYGPIVVLIVLSFNASNIITIWSGFSLDWYLSVFNNEAIKNAAKNSILVAVTATLISTTIALLAAFGMWLSKQSGKEPGIISGLIALPLIVPEIVIAVAVLIFFARTDVPLGFITIALAHSVFCIPFAYLPIRARLAGIEPSLLEAGYDLHAHPVHAFRRIILPLLRPGILAGSTLAFITSIDNFVLTYFVAGSGTTTLPVYIFSSIRAGLKPDLNAISVLMLVVSVFFVSLAFWLSRNKTSTK